MEVRRRGRPSIPFLIQIHLCILAHHLGHPRGVLQCYVILARPAVTLGTLMVQDLDHLMVESMEELVQARPCAIYYPRGFKMYCIQILACWFSFILGRGLG